MNENDKYELFGEGRKKPAIRPKRIFKNKKGYYYIINGKKKYIKSKDGINDKRLLTINVKNIIGYTARQATERGKRQQKEKEKKEDKKETKKEEPAFRGYTLNELSNIYFSRPIVPLLKDKPDEQNKKYFEDKVKLIADSVLKVIKNIDIPDVGKIMDRSSRVETVGSNTPLDLEFDTLGIAIEPTLSDRFSDYFIFDQPKTSSSPIRVKLPRKMKPPPIIEDDAKGARSDEDDEEKKIDFVPIKEEGEIRPAEPVYTGRVPEKFRKKVVKNISRDNIFRPLIDDENRIIKRENEFIRQLHQKNTSEWTKTDFQQLLQGYKNQGGLPPDKLLKFETVLNKSSGKKINDSVKLALKDLLNSYMGFGVENPTNADNGLWNTEIQDILKHKIPDNFIPVIANDQIKLLNPHIKKDTEKFGFIVNTDDSTGNGKHWKAVFLSRPDASVEIYDSLVSIPSRKFMKDVSGLVNKMDDDLLYKVKINTVKDQSDDTSNCGYFAIKFLVDRFEGKDFKNSSFYNNIDKSDKGEKDIKKFKKFL